jgi:hypothetical protein
MFVHTIHRPSSDVPRNQFELQLPIPPGSLLSCACTRWLCRRKQASPRLGRPGSTLVVGSP